MSAEQAGCHDNESTDRKHAPCEIGAERRDFRAEHVGRDMLAVLSDLPNGVGDGVGLFGLGDHSNPAIGGQLKTGHFR